MSTPNQPSFRYRSLFWPIILIGAGIIWLLANLNLITIGSLNALANLWPLLLVGIGLDILFGRRSALIGGAIGIVVVAIAIVILIAAPSLGFSQNTQVVTDRYTTPLAGVNSAQITLDLASPSSDIKALSDPSLLFDATITHVGKMDFTVSGAQQKNIHLAQTGVGFEWLFTTGAQNPRWDIGLSPQVPLDLTINGGSGSSTIDLSQLTISNLGIRTGSGSSNIRLPSKGPQYDANLRSGSGSVDMNIPSGAEVTLHLTSGSGSVSITLPASDAIRVEVIHAGSGSVSVSSRLSRVSGGGNQKTGVWQSSNYDQATSKINIVMDSTGSGSVSLH